MPFLNASKEEIVAFDQVMDAFEDNEVMSKMLPQMKIDAQQAQRTNDVLWVPEPYIMPVYTGMDQSANFAKIREQLAVPTSMAYNPSVPFSLDAIDLRDQIQDSRLGDGARQALGSYVNQQCINKMALWSSIVVKRTAAAAGFDDIAAIQIQLDEQGIQADGRNFGLTSRDYLSAIGELGKRQDTQKDSATMDAYTKAQVGDIAGMNGYRLPYSQYLAAAGGGAITTSTLDAAVQYFIPKAQVGVFPEIRNQDNRTQSLVVSATAGVKAGDSFTIANVFACHHITKQSTPSLKTFKVISVVDGTHLLIAPPVISNQVASDSGEQYQNCVVSAKSATATITWLNTAAAYVNLFWHDNAVRLIPGRYALPADGGMQVLSATTKSGIQLVMTKQAVIDTFKYKYRFDLKFGIDVLQPEMAGNILFSQP